MMYEIEDENLSAAVCSILAARNGSFLEAQSYENQMTLVYDNKQWQLAHDIADRIKGGEI